jgi:hypothetical protein
MILAMRLPIIQTGGRTPKDYAVWELHPVMKMEVIP